MIVVGGGPAGLMPAAGLRLHDVHVVVLEKLTEPTPQSRGQGLHARSVEMTDQRGLLDRFPAVSEKFQVGGLFGGITKAWPDSLATSHPYGLATPQPAGRHSCGPAGLRYSSRVPMASSHQYLARVGE